MQPPEGALRRESEEYRTVGHAPASVPPACSGRSASYVSTTSASRLFGDCPARFSRLAGVRRGGPRGGLGHSPLVDHHHRCLYLVAVPRPDRGKPPPALTTAARSPRLPEHRVAPASRRGVTIHRYSP